MSDSPANAGYVAGEIHAFLEELRQLGRCVWGPGSWADDQQKLVWSAMVVAGRKGVRVAPCFGEDGRFLGREVPALLVYQDETAETLDDVYPHQEQDGSFVTIRDYLDANLEAARPGPERA